MNDVRQWFADLRQYIEGIGHADIFGNPTRIFNADETGFPIAPKPVQVLADKGDPHIYQQGSSDKSLITALLVISAAGTYVRPMLIFPGKIFRTDFYNRFYEAIPTGQFGHSKNGWIDTELFVDWLKLVFEPHLVTNNITRPVLLFVDGARVHISLEASEFCDEKNILLYLLLPNSTHILQPLNLVVMGSIKSHYRKAVQRWGVEHPLHIYNREAFVDIFQGVYDTACTESNATKGFEVAGLYPLDEGRVDASKCFPADLFDPQNAPAELPPVNNEPETILQQDVIPGNPDAPNGNDGLPMTIRVDGVLYVRSPTQAEQPQAPATPAPAPALAPAPPAPAPPMAPQQTRLEVIDEILATPRRPAPRAMRGRGVCGCRAFHDA